MCAIGGYYSVSGSPTPVRAIKSLWRAMEARGTHAAGLAVGWKDSDKPITYKAPKRAGKMLNVVKKYAKGKNTRYVMLHTRFTTQGSVMNNGNNHPITNHGIVLTHNGVLYNDNEIFQLLNMNRVNEVDTEAINAALRHTTPQWTLENIDGSMSIAWVDERDSMGTVHLATNGENPLVIARTKSNDIVWASTKSILEKSDFVLRETFHATPYKVYTITPDGVIRSEYVSDFRCEPDYSGSYRVPQWAQRYIQPSKGKESLSGGSIPSKTDNSFEEAGWVYSHKRGWVKE